MISISKNKSTFHKKNSSIYFPELEKINAGQVIVYIKQSMNKRVGTIKQYYS